MIGVCSPGTLTADEIDFVRDVRPILASNCFGCHGPDAEHREGDLRLDHFDGSGDVNGASHSIVPGQPDDSPFMIRITSDADGERMPPPDSGKELKPEQIEILREWIAQGAPYAAHWAFTAPVRPEVPEVENAGWVRNPIDAFILARLEQHGLSPSPEADAVTLLRRLSLDLIGLPPTLEEVDQLLADQTELGIETNIERLLDSPHYGERWGRLWLDAARYADSDGFEKDKPRFVWMYRNWVIDALNNDLPYDQFIVEQIAGDLIPDATQDQIVATGFLRNSMINEEGGIDPEQFRMEAMFDRMDAIGKAVLGLTIQCGQCHSHKYDPLTQVDYYRMFAFLNNCHEAQHTVYTDEQRQRRQEILGEIQRIEDSLRNEATDWPDRIAEWEESVRQDQPEWHIVRPKLDTSGGQKHYLLEDGSILAAGYAPTKHTTEFTVDVEVPTINAVKLELLNDPSLPHGGPGRSIFGLSGLTEFTATAAPLDQPDQVAELKFSHATADVNPSEQPLDTSFNDKTDKQRVTGPIEYANDGNDLTAWTQDIGPGRSNVPHNAVFVLEKPLENEQGFRINIKLKQQHGGWNSDDNQNNNLGRFRFSVTSAADAQADPIPAAVRQALEIPVSERTSQQTALVFSEWRKTVADWKDANDRIESLWQQHPQGTTQLVLSERDEPRKTHRLNRGDFLKPEEAVTPGVPEFLHPLAETADSSRLEFAHWLVDRQSPTTARAIVNRIWQAYFGTGFVTTAEDLGTQGEPPTHPELLDWLAVELMENGWSLKHLNRLIVSSATYRQSSVVTPEKYDQDPSNRLLARGPRYRVDAELVRDIALAASGLLNPKVGGPSVYPPAPEFLFQRPASYGPKVWAYDTGPDQYRRGLYTFRFRSVPYPVLQTFDAPNGDVACVRRARSNTPLQALTTLNEPLFVQCARSLAVETITSSGSSDAERIRFAFRRCVARDPQPDEAEVLSAFLHQQRGKFKHEGADPWPLISDREEHADELPEGVTAPELAAWTALARVVLNLDETITNE
ncbi:MAG: PSD1 domain-containing protein [Planctomycetaceae bacterium]|nr:PSD1 domain-containing protein [Planctomycetaceae bacterium]